MGSYGNYGGPLSGVIGYTSRDRFMIRHTEPLPDWLLKNRPSGRMYYGIASRPGGPDSWLVRLEAYTSTNTFYVPWSSQAMELWVEKMTAYMSVLPPPYCKMSVGVVRIGNVFFAREHDELTPIPILGV